MTAPLLAGFLLLALQQLFVSSSDICSVEACKPISEHTGSTAVEIQSCWMTRSTSDATGDESKMNQTCDNFSTDGKLQMIK